MRNSHEDKSSCRFCAELDLRSVYNFRPNPYGDLFSLSLIEAQNLPSHAIELARCTSCNLLQLMHRTDLDAQYKDYLYMSSVTNNLSSFYEELAHKYIQELAIDTSLSIVDIGSNDGSFLKPFHERGYSVIGIDPSVPATERAMSSGIYTINDYFSNKVVEEIKKSDAKIGLVSINYTLANVSQLDSFLNNLSELVSEHTFISIITGYHPDQFSINMFDYIGHDHLSYFTVTDINKMAGKFGLVIVDVERIEHKGGSVRLLLARAPVAPKSAVPQILQRESWMRTYSDTEILNMLSRVEFSKQQLKDVIATFGNQPIGGIGASISTSYFIVHFELNNKIMMLFDDDPRKIGKFSPGAGIEVAPLEQLESMEIKTVLILAWQHTDKLLKRLKEVHFEGNVIVPLPALKIVKV